MKTNAIVVIAVLLLAAGGIWYASRQNQTSESMMETSRESDSTLSGSSGASDGASMMVDGVKEITIEGSEFKFSLPSMTLKKGEKVRLVFKNTGEMTHDWVVDELNVRTKIISGGSTETIEFTPDKAGTFEYYCSVGKHRENGMFGSLTVTE